MDMTKPGDVIRVGQIEIRFRLEAPDTGGHFTLFEGLVPSGARVPIPHIHETFDETIYGQAGVLSWTVDGQKIDVGPGDVLFIRRGRVHHFDNAGSIDTRILSVITPGVLGPEYFRDVAAVLNIGGPPDLQRLGAVMQRHGLRPAQHPT